MKKTIWLTLLVIMLMVVLVKSSAVAAVNEKVTLIGVVKPSYDGLEVGVIEAMGNDGKTIIFMRGGRYKIIGDNISNMERFKDRRVQIEGIYREKNYNEEILVKSINETTKTELDKEASKLTIAGTLATRFNVNSPYLILSLEDTAESFYMVNKDFIQAGGNSLFGKKVIITYIKARTSPRDKDIANLAIDIRRGD